MIVYRCPNGCREKRRRTEPYIPLICPECTEKLQKCGYE